MDDFWLKILQRDHDLAGKKPKAESGRKKRMKYEL